VQTSTLRADVAPVRSLISEDEFAAVVATVLRDNEGMEQVVAERITEEALGFVAACARTDGAGMRPSRAVDKGWHALILHTHTYQGLCARLGRFVHHRPDQPPSVGARADALERTRELMTEAGYEPDHTLWLRPSGAAECEGGPAPCCDYCGPGK
jgi:hypothetical protein